MKAVIMAGGEGTRLRPLTSNTPKPMLPMANKPMMEHVISLLRRHGFEEIVVTVAFMANAIRTYFGDGSEFGLSMVYATEESPLGTAGSVLNAAEQLTERFLVISGDVLTDIDLAQIVKFHDDKGALCTIALKSVDNPLEFGIVITREDGSIERFLEKPTWGQVFSDTINTGIYVLEPEIFDFIEQGRPVDFAGDVFPAVLEAGRPIYGDIVDGYWEDVGTLDAYLKSHEDILDQKVNVHLDGFPLRPGIWLGKGAEVDPDAHLEGPAILGDNCRIGAGARIGRYCTLGTNVRTGNDTSIERSVVHDNSYIGNNCKIEGAVLGKACDIRQATRIENGVVMGEGCAIGRGTIIRSGVKIYPYKTVEQGAIVNSSIVWETRGSRTIFGRNGVTGLANVDISPEFVVRLFMAWASTLDKGSRITASRDTSRAARVLKRAAMVGCNAAGVTVDDLEVATVPATRFMVRSASNQGGFTVRLADDDRHSIVLRFFDENGRDVDESMQRKVERLYHREDFRRVPAPEIGDISFVSRAIEQYTAELLDTVDIQAIASAGFKLVLDYSFGTASFVMPNVLAKLGADVLVSNPYGATAPAGSTDRWAALKRVSDLVTASGAHLGAIIDPGGEQLVIIDDSGAVLSETQSLMVMLDLVLKTGDRPQVMLPLSTPASALASCKQAGVDPKWMKLYSNSSSDAPEAGKITFAANHSNAYAFPGFIPAYDAVCSLVNLLAMLAASRTSLSRIVSGIPDVHIVHEEVITPSDHKGTIMRLLIEQTAERDVTLIEGIKIIEDTGWTWVLPDPEEPLTHVWVEAPTHTEARTRAQQYAVRIRQMLR
ncbi:MAG: sugar phosphate nucleotidyltransferase [Actinobacteria bacterium]|nr:sugar phosphate nucleotidyltransferase [Actinomycetota bacterium]